MILTMQARLFQNAMIAVFLLFLRLEAGRPAVATATVTAGLVSGVVLVDGGEGYLSAPSVAFVGGGGTGASAVAILNGNSVGAIVVTTAGGGYTSAPSVVIGGPPPAIDPATLQIDTIPRLTIAGMQGTTNAVQWIDSLTPPGQWNLLTNVILGGSPAVILDTTAPTGARRFYRVVTTNGEPPGRPPGFVWIPPGRFLMGSPHTEEGRLPAFEAQHPVVISRGFWISSTETTAGQYGEITKQNPGAQTDQSLPVVRVTWRDATNYCDLLTKAEAKAGRLPAGYVYRLPTEAEWEYAARAGTDTAFSFGDDPSELSKYGWVGQIDINQPRRVASLLSNPWGLFDVHGNVSEWCLDYHAPYPLWEVTDPLVAGSDDDRIGSFQWRVFRGGNVGGQPYGGAAWLRSASRWNAKGSELTGTLNLFIGFRTVLGPPVVVTEIK